MEHCVSTKERKYNNHYVFFPHSTCVQGIIIIHVHCTSVFLLSVFLLSFSVFSDGEGQDSGNCIKFIRNKRYSPKLRIVYNQRKLGVSYYLPVNHVLLLYSVTVTTYDPLNCGLCENT